MNKIILLTFIIWTAAICCIAQEVKKMNAVRTGKSPKIDGVLDDEAWQNAPIAANFIEFRPNPGKPEKESQKTEVKIVYDNSAIYVAARMYDNPDSIAREIAARDQVGNADFFGVIFDTYLDKINANGFYVTAAGSQFDAKYSAVGGEDSNWNAVWESNVKIDKEGWVAEMKIPYSALRFSNKDIQQWGINMTRKRQKIQQQFMWSPVDPKKNGFINQSGEISGISNIKAPVRLSFSPYISGYISHYPYKQPGVKNTRSSFNGGMDIKYGITPSFTLDMTLVPDFGQVQSDNRVLNLSPFEVKFNENRPFFTEGTELFSKGGLFYSRRIGSNPNYLANVETLPGENIIKNPIESKILNATKISGRTAKGLGIGFFNAITSWMQARVEDAQGNQRSVENQPLTNYNIIVFDQSLKNNSSLSFVNTNVLRQGSVYDANVSAVDFSLNDKKNVWNVSGTGRLSYLNGGTYKNNTGYSYDLKFGKQSGKFIYKFFQKLTDDKYESNDLGLLFNNNFFNNSLYAEMNLYKGKKLYNEWNSYLELFYSRRFKPRAYQNFEAYAGMYMQFKNLWYGNFNIDWQPQSNDFYEARNGMVFRTSATQGINMSLSSNRSKKYNALVFGAYRIRKQFEGMGYDAGFYQNLRINNKFSVGNDFSYQPRLNYAGWVGTLNDQTIFSRFDRQTIENSIDAKYTFNTKMGFTLRARHYWSNRQNKDFYNLNTNGDLEADNAVDNTYDRNFNAFNLDMNYTWQFAPGSELTLAWKDIAEDGESLIRKGYRKNFNHIFSAPQNNSLSLKILYYVDYLQLRKKS